MSIKIGKPKESKRQSMISKGCQDQNDHEPTFQFTDNRPGILVQRKLQAMINNSQREKSTQLQAKDYEFSNNQQVLVPNELSQAENFTPKSDTIVKKNNVIQGAFVIGADEKDSEYINGLDESDYNNWLGDVEFDDVKALMLDWVNMESVKQYDNINLAVKAAVVSLNAYGSWHYNSTDFANSHFTDKQLRGLYSFLGEDTMEKIVDDSVDEELEIIYTKGGIGGVDQIHKKFPNIFAFCGILGSFTTQQWTDYLGSFTCEDFGTLVKAKNPTKFINLCSGLGHVNAATLSFNVSTTLMDLPALDLVNLGEQWAGLRGWLNNLANLNPLLVMKGAGYTFAQCTILAAHGGTAQEVRNIQANALNFITLNGFITEAKRYNLTWDDMNNKMTENPNAAILVLQNVIRTEALTLIDKDTHFIKWIHAVDNLMNDLAYVLAFTGSTELSGGGVWERTVTVSTGGGVLVDTFVIHYHPGASGAQVGSPNSSKRHLKPERGNSQTPHMYWSEIPVNVLGAIPGAR